MINRKLIAMGVAAIFSLTASNIFAAGLTLQSKREPSAINVSCNGQTGLPIPSNSKLGPLPFSTLAILFGNPLNCTFTEISTNLKIGKATLTLSNGNQKAEITKMTNEHPADFSIGVSPSDATSTPVSAITVVMTKLN